MSTLFIDSPSQTKTPIAPLVTVSIPSLYYCLSLPTMHLLYFTEPPNEIYPKPPTPNPRPSIVNSAPDVTTSICGIVVLVFVSVI